MRSYILLLGLLLLASVAFSQFDGGAQAQGSLWVTQAYTPTGAQINASLLVFESGQPQAGIAAVNQNADIAAACKISNPDNMQACIIEKSKELSFNTKLAVNSFYSVKDANFSFMYWNPYKAEGPGDSPVPGCAKVTASNQEIIKVYNATSQTVQDITIYTAKCDVSKDIYAGRTITVKVTSSPVGNIQSITDASTTLSDANASSASMFSSSLSNLLQGAAQGQLPCLGVFLVLGLLLASMYFAGRSPITLLDITTPRLPSPKGFVAGGQIITPFGYTEMKRVTKGKMEAAEAVAALMLKEKGKTTVKGPTVMDSAVGTSWKAIGGKDANTLKAIQTTHEARTEEQHALVRQALNQLERAGGKYAMLAKTAHDYNLSQNLMSSLDTLTFKAGKGYAGRIAGGLQKMTQSALSINRFAAAGFVPTALDSTFRSMKLLGRGTKSAVVMSADLARETGKWAVETVGGKGAMKAMEEKAKRSAGYAWLYDQMGKKPREIKIGTIKQINQNMAHLYNTLSGEVERDQLRYLLKQIYRKMGVNVANMTDKEIFEMSHSIVDPLKKCIGPNANLAREAEIMAILSDGRLSVTERRDKLEGMLRNMGGVLDSNYMRMKAEVDKIAHEQIEGHVKLITLQMILDTENSRLQAAKEGESRLDNAYYSLVGRGSLHGSDLAEMAVFRRMMYDCENGHTTKGVSIRDFLTAFGVDLQNRIKTLNPDKSEFLPEFMRNKAVLSKQTEENRRALASLLTDDGERVLRELTGKNKNNASINDFMAVLYGNKYMHRSHGIQVDDTSGVHIDPKTGKTLFWEEDKAIGPQKGWWKVDMKRMWTGGIDTADLGQAGPWVEGKATRSFMAMDASKPSLAAVLDRYPGAKSWSPEKRMLETKKLWVKDHIESEMHNNFNDRFAMNAYGGTTNEVMRYYGNAAAALLSKALRDAGHEERHTDLRFLETMDVNKAKDMERLKYMLGERYKKEFEDVLKRGVTFDDISRSKQVWMMTHEGSYLPYKQGMPASDNDRMMNGHVALRDDKGVWRRYNPDDVRVDAKSFGGRHDLMEQFNRLGNSTNKVDWEPFIHAATKWSKEGGYNYEREKVMGAVLWRYSNTTNDYMKYWNNSGVKLIPRHEATPLAPSVLRFFGVDAPGLTSTLKPFRDFGQILGRYLVGTTLDGVGEWQMRSYDVTPKSQMLKMQSWRFATQIMTTDWKEQLKDVTSEHDRRQLASAYEAVALAHGRYHNVWAFTIDRNPWRASTSHGLHQAASAAFPLGPAMTYSMKSNLRGYMDKYEYGSFMAAYGWPAMMSRKAIMPYQKMIAGAQRSLTGYMSKWDTMEDQLKSFGQHTSPRLLESLRMYNPMSFSWGRGWASQKLGMLNKFQSRAEQAQLTGYDHQMGLKQSYADIKVVHKGAAAIARTGLANPGASYMDTRFNEQLAPAMAEYAMMRGDSFRGYLKNDEYVRGQAMTDTIHRTVSSEALAIKRQQELMGFGVTQNSLYTWFNPVLFAYHMGIPGFPESLSPKELLTSFVNKYRKGGGGGNLESSMKDFMNRTGQAMGRAFTPWKASMVKYCKCGSPGYSPGMCKKCGSRL